MTPISTTSNHEIGTYVALIDERSDHLSVTIVDYFLQNIFLDICENYFVLHHRLRLDNVAHHCNNEFVATNFFNLCAHRYCQI